MGPEHNFWFIQFKDVVTILILIATAFAIVWEPIKAVQMRATTMKGGKKSVANSRYSMR